MVSNTTNAASDADSQSLTCVYETLWQQALTHFLNGQVEIDDFLAGRRPDHRLGLTIIARPSPEVTDHLTAVIRRVAEVEPEQYFYRPGDLHFTILSLFTATEQWQPYFLHLPEYLAAVDEVLTQTRRFTIALRGVTATPGAVLAQGFPCDETLSELRNRLREALHRHHLGHGLDARYRIVTAHLTMMRFRRQPVALPQLMALLQAYREYPFGETPIEALYVVKNDWYMTAEKVEVLAAYRLLSK